MAEEEVREADEQYSQEEEAKREKIISEEEEIRRIVREELAKMREENKHQDISGAVQERLKKYGKEA